jgi:hypothetical protein
MVDEKKPEAKAFIYFIPPSWLIAGIEERIDGPEIVLSAAAYIESTQDTNSCWDVGGNAKAAGKSWPMPAGTRIRADGILIRAPADPKEVLRLARAGDREILRGAK